MEMTKNEFRQQVCLTLIPIIHKMMEKSTPQEMAQVLSEDLAQGYEVLDQYRRAFAVLLDAQTAAIVTQMHY